MKNSHLTIESMLTDWGQAQRIPSANADMRNLVLNSLSSSSTNILSGDSSRTTKYLKRFFIPLAVSGLVILLIISVNTTQKSSPLVGTFANQMPADTGLRMSEGRSVGSTLGGSLINSFGYVVDSIVAPAPEPSLPYQTTEIPTTDTREFMKTDFNAKIKTRHAQKLTGKIQTIIRGYDGRIDNASSSPKYGSISFVIPQNKLEDFRSELSELAGAKFIEETTTSQNLLSQKQNIEQGQKHANDNLASVTAQRDQLSSNHTQTVNDFQSRLNFNSQKIAKANSDDELRQLQQERANLNYQLTNENSNYESQLAYLNSQIDSYHQNLDALSQQDTALTETVNTVRGTINLTGINFWQVINAYLPKYWLIYVSVILIILALLLHKPKNKFIL